MSDAQRREDEDQRNTEEQLEALREDINSKIKDVRSRVVQVKQEVDTKPPADHEHEAVLERLDAIEDRLGEEDGTGGLMEVVEELEQKVETLAASVIDVQDRLDEHAALAEDLKELESSVSRIDQTLGSVTDRAGVRQDLDRLLEAANLAGVRRARCEECSTVLDIALLTEPACPSCGRAFVDVEAGGFLRSGTLQVGSVETVADASENPPMGRNQPDPSDRAQSGGSPTGGGEQLSGDESRDPSATEVDAGTGQGDPP